MVVKSLGILSVGKVTGTLYALLGLLIGGFFSLFAFAGAALGGRNAGPAAILIGAGAILFIPVLYGVLGFIGGIIGAALYNVVASLAGGIEIELGPAHGEHVE